MLYISCVEVVDEVLWWRRIIIRVSDVVNTTAGICVIWTFDKVAAYCGSLRTCRETVRGGEVCLGAVLNVVRTSARDGHSRFHEVVDRFVDGFDTVGVMDGKLRIIRSLDELIDDTIADAEGVEIKAGSIYGTILNALVLIIEIVEKYGTVMTACSKLELTRL